MGYEAVMFDMDGLMVDTERLAMKAWLETCTAYGQEITDETYKNTIGRTGASIRDFYLDRFGNDFPIDEAFADCDTLYLKYLDESKNLAKLGLHELISFLIENDVSRGVCSSSTRKKIEYKLAKIGVRDSMLGIVGGDEVERGKPHPEPYLILAERLGVAIEKCLVLEDSYNGIRSASSAGAHVVMVPDLLEPTDEMRGICLDIVGSLRDVIELI